MWNLARQVLEYVDRPPAGLRYQKLGHSKILSLLLGTLFDAWWRETGRDYRGKILKLILSNHTLSSFDAHFTRKQTKKALETR